MPVSFRPWRNAASRCANGPGDTPLRNPITGIAACCAWVPSGQAVAALPSSDKRLDDADKAERLLRNLARRLDQEAPGVATSILEGLDEMLTVIRLGLPVKLKRLIGKMP